MASPADLWGNIQVADVRTPAAILREQAALLGTKTQNVVEAKVISGTEDNEFYHSFNLIVPALDYYTYSLFTIRHDVNLYPVRINRGPRLESEQEFTDWLRKTLSSPETTKIVQNLLAQANS
jgi:hypothetical protein